MMSVVKVEDVAVDAKIGRVHSALSWEPPLQDLAGGLFATPTLAAVLLLLTFPILSVLPRPGPDPSWQAGLYLALEGGFQFGRDFIFTYGPLGFLHAPVLYGEGLFLVAIGFTIMVRLALVAALLSTARRSLPLPIALAVCYLVLVAGHLNSALILLAFLCAFAALDRRSPSIPTPVLAAGGGAIAAVELLGKLNYGISILVLCLIAVVALPGRRRNLALLTGSFAGCLVLLWSVTGQALANLPAYFSNSAQIVSGYSQSMGVDIDTRPHEFLIALGAVALLLGVALLVTRAEKRCVLRWASLLLLAFFAFAVFKQDFIRRGIEGRNDFALMMTAAAFAVAARLPAGGRVPKAVMAGALIAPMAAIVIWANPLPSFLTVLDPREHLIAAREDLDVVTSSSLRRHERDAARQAMKSVYAVPPSLLRRIGDRSVAFEPWEIGVAWAYGLNWKPLPVIQDYSAYTSALDHLNASALAESGPETILRQPTRGSVLATVASVDDRYPAWDPPAVSIAMLCDYAEIRTPGEWQLLERVPDRCGPDRALASLETRTGTPIEVPAAPGAGEIVYARIHGMGPDLAERLRTVAYRGPLGWVSFEHGRRWNFEQATAGDGLILCAPEGVDYRRPFQLAPDAQTFEVGIDGAGSRPITVSFFSRKVEPRRVALGTRATGSKGPARS